MPRRTSSHVQLFELLRAGIPNVIPNEKLVFQHLRLRQGQRVCPIGQAFDNLFVVRAGFLKTVTHDDAGVEHVVGFPMKGDLLGADAIDCGFYPSEAVALSVCDLVIVPFKRLLAFSQSNADVAYALHRVLSREISRERARIAMQGRLGAEARVARFLVATGDRFARIGFSRTAFDLPMSREEIGSYLGTTLETVSRALTTFDQLGFISVNHRAIVIHAADTLKQLRRVHAAHSRASSGAARSKAAPAPSEDSPFFRHDE